MKNKILAISIIFILLSFIFINNNVFAASYNLSDYSNHVSDKSWCIVYSYNNDTFYLIVAKSTDYKYIYSYAMWENDDGETLGGRTIFSC